MDVSRIRALRGPNLWSRHTAIQAIVTCTGNELAIARLPGFETRLRARFPELGELIPTDHLDSVSMAHALEYAALGLQAQAGCPVTFSRTTQTVDTGVYQVVEVVQQLRGEAGENQIPDAKIGMTQNIGGSGSNIVTHILERVN